MGMDNFLSPSNSSIGQNGGQEMGRFASDAEILATTAVACIVGSFGCLSNILMLVGIASNYVISENPMNIFLFSQGLADLGIASIVVALHIVFLYHEIPKIVLFSARFFIAASVFSILLLTMNRFVSIIWSYKYVRVMTVKKAKRLSVALWCYVTILRVFDVTGPPYLERLGRYIVLVSLVAYLLCYIVIFKVSRDKQRRMTNLDVTVGSVKDNNDADIKSFKTIAILMFTYVLGFLPLTVVAILVDRDKEKLTFRRYTSRCLIATYISSAVNPLLYYLRSPNFRRFAHRFYRVYIAPKVEFRGNPARHRRVTGETRQRTQTGSTCVEEDRDDESNQCGDSMKIKTQNEP